jgi:integrase
MDIHTLINRNRLPRKQKGEIIETRTTFFARYYHTAEDGTRKQKAVKLCEKSDRYRSKTDVQPLMDRLMESVNAGQGSEIITGQESLSDFIEKHYFPWCEVNKSAPTVNGYKQIWNCYLKPHIGSVALVNLTTAQVTAVLTHLAKNGGQKKTGLGRYALSHIKFVLSGVYEYAIATGVLPVNTNPVLGAKWLVKVRRPVKQREYSLQEIQSMLAILEPLDLRAAVAVALCYFAALRPAEMRGLQWTDWTGEELNVRRTVWRSTIGETKTEESAGSVPVIEPLRSLLEKLRSQSAGEYILSNGSGKPLSLDSLNTRVIAPVLRAAHINWCGYYPGRRGISSLVTDTSKNALNSTGLLRHSTPITALKHYTRAQKESIRAALDTFEQMATKPAETVQ